MSWLSDPSANRINKAYIKNFFDLSGNFKVRNAKSDWSQLGDIDGEAGNDQSGYSVSLSSDGTIVAIGAWGNDGTGRDAGHVRVYEYSGSTWTQLGQDIDGEAAGDRSGYSVSLSSNGTIVAIGARYNDGTASNAGHVRVYGYNGSSWSQIGSDIDGEAASDDSGYSVSLSSNGTIVAIGARLNDGNGSNAGHVRVYQYSGGSWSKIGSDINGEAAGDELGYSVSLSSDGTIVAIGAIGNDGTASNAGHVRVYEYSGGSWSQLGQDIDGEAGETDRSGWSVSLSSDGTIVAIGAINNDGNGTDAGHVRVYEYNGSAWSQLGSDIDGEAAGDNSGWSVSLSSDGTIVAIGAYDNGNPGGYIGHVRVYEYSGGSWSQLGSTIDGVATGNRFGMSVSLSSDGTIVAAGSPYHRGVGNNTGHVRVFEYEGTLNSSPDDKTVVLDMSGGTVDILKNTMNISSGIVDIRGTNWINRRRSGATIADAYQGGLVIESSTISSSDAVLHVETAGQTQAFSVRADGSMYSANTLRHSSDDRRKINEQLITNATETIKKLSPQIYTKLNAFEENGGTPTKTESGLIAQEVYYSAPELRHLVFTDGQPLPYDLSGNDIQNDPDYTALGWGPKTATVNYIGLLPYLIKSNQEQQETIDNKQQQIADNKKVLEEDIQSRIAALES